MTVAAINEKWDSIEDNPLVIIDELGKVMRPEWADNVDGFMDDSDFGKVLDIAIRILGGDLPEQSKVAVLCVKLEAHAIKFRTLYSYYMGPAKGTPEANMKKNMYKELYTGIDRLVDALKYLMK